ncbi:chromosome segregation protein [Pseudarthrobacter defluvii]|uniref:chromosome segregation protein SMC n=1 Tax=Pseudarthrobacter defluvii TaxID=410837 RepID=UPI00278A35FA|nr:chromosome segregation protein SMC [Pseudarthrobacter defluvii]MDQ0768763.1 chromosome segregation protein [Pseudarthrobacter defluvii]
MHLKSLTVRGFKSFASATTFDFEPGVTAVVGPNGSGKSNVVDALAWVMGEQGAKTLRGGKMEDVIFAGTSGRPPLGRAHVSLTIDNTDGALPIEYSEVTISRTLFRTGGSEYAINGAGCRLLDIQELLSDSGLGREMHVIVGQGQLDRVLHATPEDRRGFIEEAAGILKHRRRKERTVRKLEAMQANLQRLTDLTGEIRRQLTPLGKQAEVARRAQRVQFDVRDARARLLADDLVQLQLALEQDVADEAALKARRTAVEQELEAGRRQQASLEQLAAEATPRLNAARDTWYRLSTARERLRSLGSLATERSRLLGSDDAAPAPGRDPEQLERQAARVRQELAELEQDIESRRSALDAASAAKADAEQAALAEDQRLTAQLRAAADRREGLARLAGQVAAARSRVESAQAELGRLRESLAAGTERRARAQAEFTALENQVAGVEEGEESLDADYEAASETLDAVLQEIADLKAAVNEGVRKRDALAARLDALKLGLDRKDGARHALESGLAGVRESLAAAITVRAGYEAAVAAALGQASEAVLVQDQDAALAVLQRLKDDDAGRASLLLASAASGPQGDGRNGKGHNMPLPEGAQWAADLVDGPAGPVALVRHLLAGTAVVTGLDAAAALVASQPGMTAVTSEGDVFTAATVAGGSAKAPSLLEVQAAVDDADRSLSTVTADLERNRFALAAAEARRAGAQAEADAALDKLHESDARLAAVAERLGHLNSVLRSAVGESERLAASLARAEENVAAEQEALAAVTARLAAAQEAPVEEEPSTEQRDALARAASAARAAEVEARLSLRSAEEQLAATRNRVASLERAAATERRAREEAAERARRRRIQAKRAAAVSAGVELALKYVDISVDLARHERDLAEENRELRDRGLREVREANDALARELAQLTDNVHRDELARAQQRARIEAVETRSVDELGISPEALVEEFGPHVPVPVPAEESSDKWAALRAPVDAGGEEIREGKPYVRQEQEKRLRKAERDLASLGKVNPLALEEFAALEERHQFLSTQLEDLKASRRDLLDIIKEVDDRVQRVFAEAFEDTQAQFVRVFDRLFPGGEGRLVLTDPADMLTTGIEVEARPAGKKIKRLSLLSGGERSLTAVALLVAIFKARPSPFYVMDEVEAALDDTNLGRLITIFEELRESSQLIVITHQKRTMEVADALYGVTMRGDGVSTVISQRLGVEA